MVSYDHIWHSFINKCKTTDLAVPTSPEAIYETIQNAIRYYNNRMSESIVGDDESEQIDTELNDNEMLVLTHYIRLIILENELIYQSTLYSPFTKELGVRNVANQRVRLEELVKSEKKNIEGFILNMSEDFL